MKFYVYELIDPRDGSVFYVGKGQRNRCTHHEAEAHRGVYSRKCDRIREIWAAARDVDVRIVERFASEAAAYAAEAARIEQIGLDRLTNVMPGGVPVCPVRLPRRQPWSEKSLAKLAPKLARALRLISETGGVYVIGHDMTEWSRGLVVDLAIDLGVPAVRSALLRHGIEIELSDAPQ